jgi:hypothetical protein
MLSVMVRDMSVNPDFSNLKLWMGAGSSGSARSSMEGQGWRPGKLQKQNKALGDPHSYLIPAQGEAVAELNRPKNQPENKK